MLITVFFLLCRVPISCEPAFYLFLFVYWGSQSNLNRFLLTILVPYTKAATCTQLNKHPFSPRKKFLDGQWVQFVHNTLYGFEDLICQLLNGVQGVAEAAALLRRRWHGAARTVVWGGSFCLRRGITWATFHLCERHERHIGYMPDLPI